LKLTSNKQVSYIPLSVRYYACPLLARFCSAVCRLRPITASAKKK
jgi:hypothetical protein